MDNDLLDELLQQYDAEKKQNDEDRKNKKRERNRAAYYRRKARKRKEADDIALELVMSNMESDKTSKKRKRVQVHTKGLAKFLKKLMHNIILLFTFH